VGLASINRGLTHPTIRLRDHVDRLWSVLVIVQEPT
jgi:hypothetical protein